VELIRQLDFLLFEAFRGFWDLTCEFWAENEENNCNGNKQKQIPCGDDNKKGEDQGNNNDKGDGDGDATESPTGWRG
jgi:hypothetical protein